MLCKRGLPSRVTRRAYGKDGRSEGTTQGRECLAGQCGMLRAWRKSSRSVVMASSLNGSDRNLLQGPSQCIKL